MARIGKHSKLSQLDDIQIVLNFWRMVKRNQQKNE